MWWWGRGDWEGIHHHFIHTLINLESARFFLEIIHNTSCLLFVFKYSLFFVWPLQGTSDSVPVGFLSNVVLPL